MTKCSSVADAPYISDRILCSIEYTSSVFFTYCLAWVEHCFLLCIVRLDASFFLCVCCVELFMSLIVKVEVHILLCPCRRGFRLDLLPQQHTS